MTTRIIGTGSYLPETIVKIDYFSIKMYFSDDLISTWTVINDRHLLKVEN